MPVHGVVEEGAEGHGEGLEGVGVEEGVLGI